jgi:carboxymethylenebutenolidase
MVLHAWWGLNGFFRGFCDRLGREGFTVVAPDLYNGAVAETIDQAKKLKAKTPARLIKKQLEGALRDIATSHNPNPKKVGVVGFSMGAYWALWLAENSPKRIGAVVLFYGTGRGDYSNSQAAYLGHFAEEDKFCSERSVRDLEKSLRVSGKGVSFYTYPATRHWFFEEDRQDAYDPSAADLAWKRTLRFLRAEL